MGSIFEVGEGFFEFILFLLYRGQFGGKLFLASVEVGEFDIALAHQFFFEGFYFVLEGIHLVFVGFLDLFLGSFGIFRLFNYLLD